MDKSGRWWRESDEGTLEEALRRATGGSPVLGPLLDGFLHGYAQFFLWIATLSAFAGMGALFRCGRGRISGVVGAVVGVVAHPVLLRFGRHEVGASH